jgi:hypothetical protein
MRPSLLLLGCLTVLGTSRPAVCAQSSRLKPGARLRLDAPTLGGRITGTLIAWEPEADRLVVSVDGDAAGLGLIIPTDSVTRIEVRRERRMPLEGLGLGLLGGTLLAAVASPDCVDENGESTALACLAYKVSPRFDTRAAVLGGVGALVGLIVGSETTKRTWAPVHLEQLRVGPGPDDGLAFGVRISF